MNYKAELRGFALDRALRIAEINKNCSGLDDLISAADTIVEYIYISDKDIDSHLSTVIPLIVASNNIDRIEALILELQQIKAELEARNSRNEGVN
jgi:hypothetical protein